MQKSYSKKNIPKWDFCILKYINQYLGFAKDIILYVESLCMYLYI